VTVYVSFIIQHILALLVNWQKPFAHYYVLKLLCATVSACVIVLVQNLYSIIAEDDLVVLC